MLRNHARRCGLPSAGLVLAVVALPALGADSARGQDYLVGVARIDVTPDFPVRLAGFYSRRAKGEASEVSERIWAKALAIDDGQPAVLVTLDNCGVSAAHTAELARRLAEKAKLPRERLALTVTHTHSAPMLRGVLVNMFGQELPPAEQAHVERYTDELLDKLEKVALAALADRRPARLVWGIGESQLAINRRDPKGPVDRDLPVLVVRDPDGDRIRAVYLNLACHCVTLSDNKINGDWAGYAQQFIEKAHPGAVALVSIGCGADCNPRSGVTLDKVELCAEQGAEVARAVEQVVGGFMAPVAGPIAAELKSIELELVPASKEAFQELAAKQDQFGQHARLQLAELERGTLKTKIDYPIGTWKFGDSLAMVFLGGEVVTDYSLRLKKELDGRRLWINAYANDVPCYIPSEEVLKNPGYEGGGAMVYYNLPGPLRSGVEQRIVDVVKAEVGPAFAAPLDPVRTGDSLPLSPQRSAAAIRLPAGFVAELAVAEPLVIDPVAIQWGPDGRLWVVEMHDYPQGVPNTEKPGGRICVLADTDDDGRYDTRTVFLDGIPFPTGVTPWRRGLLVCAAPDILYAEDADGDGRAEIVRKLFSGFGTENFQGRVNSLEYGLDNWVYGSCGLFGGRIVAAAAGRPASVVELGNRDFRIHPDEQVLEAVTGRSQQGRVRDDGGNWFGCSNSVLAVHYPLEDRYLGRNPHVEPPAAEVILPAGPDPQRLFPLKSDVQLFKLSGTGQRATAACGLGVYRDDLLGADFQENLFTCEPVHLVVHRQKLSPRASTFAGERAADEQASEFLASTDNWFRPVQARTGPDGGLWIVDMCRYVIEHPRWIPPDDLARLDTRAGDTLGRIYRVRPAAGGLRKIPRLDRMDAAQLVAALDSPNGWQRDMAGQLLVWRGERKAIAPLEALAMRSGRALARLHALCVLEGLAALRPELVLTGLRDADAGVRRHAIRLSEPLLKSSAQLGPALLAMTEDADPQIRLQLACTLGQWSDPRAGATVARIALLDPADPYLAAAALSSLNAGNIGAALRAAFADRQNPPPMPLGARLVALAIALGENAELPRAMTQITSPGRSAGGQQGSYAAWQMTALADVLSAVGRSGKKFDQLSPGVAEPIRRMLADARGIAGEDSAGDDNAASGATAAIAAEALRLAAIGVLGRAADEAEADRSVLAALLIPQNSASVQSAALAALARIADPRVAGQVLAGWEAYTPELRADALGLLMSRDAWQKQLLNALEDGRVPAAQLDAHNRQRLAAHPDERVRQRAEKLLAQATSTSRQSVLQSYRPALSLTGDRQRGKLVFARVCANCHRLEDQGHAVGPDLAAQARGKPAEFVLTEVLDPNRNTDSRYTEYIAATTSGTTIAGILTSANSTAITLAGSDGRQQTLLRSELDALRNTGKSLMPEGLEKDITQQQMADLIAYVLAASVAPAEAEK